MRQPEIILTIAGSDSSGGAGVQADMKTISALGGYAATVITTITAQNTMGVQEVYPLPPAIVKQQLTSVMDDLHPKAIKIGMVHDESLVHVIAEAVKHYGRQAFIVYDPVMISTSGRQLMSEAAIRKIQDELFPLCTLVTPNLNEASLLNKKDITDTEGMIGYGEAFVRHYQTNVLIKGGHLSGNIMNDILYETNGEHHEYESTKIETTNLHGTGCTLSSAIATYLAQGLSLKKAVGSAKDYITNAILNAKHWHIGKGNGPLCHFF